MNGNTVKLRIIASGIIAVVVVLCGSWLLSHDTEVPFIFWLVSIIAMAGVAGADAVTSVAAILRPPTEGKQ
jgi:uncharacterized membrane protein